MNHFACKLKEIINVDTPMKVLDVGTGRGNFMINLLDTFHHESQFIGIDLKDESLAIARENITNDNVRFVAMNAEQMSFVDDTFDVVCISNSLHHLPNCELVLQEMKRVLKPSGQLIVSEMFSDNLSQKQHSHVWLHHFSAEIDRISGNFHVQTYEKSSLIAIVEQCGFEIISMFESSTHDEQLLDENSEEESEILKRTHEAISQLICKLKDSHLKEAFQSRLDEKMEELYQIGYFNATTLTIIAR